VFKYIQFESYGKNEFHLLFDQSCIYMKLLIRSWNIRRYKEWHLWQK